MTRPYQPLTTVTPRLEVCLRAFNHGQNRTGNHCLTVARLFLDKQITAAERDMLLLHTQALTGEMRKTVLQNYRDCEEEYNKYLAEQALIAKQDKEKKEKEEG